MRLPQSGTLLTSPKVGDQCSRPSKPRGQASLDMPCAAHGLDALRARHGSVRVVVRRAVEVEAKPVPLAMRVVTLSYSPSSNSRPGEGEVWVVTQTNTRTRAESQQIVATRPLYCLQYPVLSQSSAKDLPQ